MSDQSEETGSSTTLDHPFDIDTHEDKLSLIHFFLPGATFDKLDRHLKLKALVNSKTQSKRAWVIQAILERLQEPLEKDIRELRQVGTSIRVSKEMREQIDSRVSAIKAKLTKFSRKKWIVEAIVSKLEREEKLTGDVQSALRDFLQ